MRLLFDQNLSRRLIGELTEPFPDSAHVQAVGLEMATDREILGPDLRPRPCGSAWAISPLPGLLSSCVRRPKPSRVSHDLTTKHSLSCPASTADSAHDTKSRGGVFGKKLRRISPRTQVGLGGFATLALQ